MSQTVPAAIVSPQDLTAVLLEVRQYARWFNQATIRQRVAKGKAEEPPAASAATVQLLQDWSAKQPLSQARLDELVDSLTAWQEAAPVIRITLAAPPTNAVRQELTAWCRANLAANALLAFGFNATLLGGMVVSYGSRIFDWSFRRQILAARATFPEVLRRV